MAHATKLNARRTAGARARFGARIEVYSSRRARFMTLRLQALKKMAAKPVVDSSKADWPDAADIIDV